MQTAPLDMRQTPEPQVTLADGVIASCWSCRGPVAGEGLFCGTCGAVQPPAAVDHFARLGLARTFDIDADGLDRGYFAAQRRLHPDRFASRTQRERTFSQLQAVSLNEAYETLRDPVRRAEYLIGLNGVEVVPEGCSLVGEQDLLQEVMERREELAEAESVGAVEALEASAGDDVARCVDALSAVFATGDLPAAARLTTRMRYLGKYIQECRSRRARLGRPA